jgi:cytochrome c oxidase subunit IV
MENIFLLEEILKMQRLSGLINEKDYKSNLKKINTFENSSLGQITKALQKEYINNIHKSSLFSESECKYLKDYFKTYESINESNIRKHNLLLKEGFFGDVAKFFGDAWNKIKEVYGNIKNFVLKIWEFLKNSAVKIGNASYTFIKNQLNSKRQAMEAYLAKVQDKQGLSKEVIHCKKIFEYLKNLIKSLWDTLTSKLQSNPELNSGDLNNQLSEIFKSRKMFKLFETAQAGQLSLHPEDLIKNPVANKIVKFIMTALKIVLNPYAALFVYLTNFYIGKSFQITNFIVNKIGGPEVINWVILPPMMTVVMENLPSIHHQLEDMAMEFLSEIVPYAKELVQTAGIIYFVYGWYEFCAGLANM